ncbi:MAG: hypothetical protein AAGB48_06595 [Planctomycetota bacterium]
MIDKHDAHHRDPAEHSEPHSVLASSRLFLYGADRLVLSAGIAILALAPLSIMLAFFDPRIVDGANLWHKPLKFQLSVGLYLITLAMIIPGAGTRFRGSLLGRSTIVVALGTSVFEIAWITFRAANAQRSHYATDTGFETSMYALMGIAAVLLSLTPLVFAIACFFPTKGDGFPAALRVGILVGSVVTLLGGATVGGMLSGAPVHYPTDQDDAQSRIPFVGWSLERGDLRIAHFVGLHALQGFIAMGLLLSRIPVRFATAALIIGAAGWLFAVAWLVALAQGGSSPFAIFP